MVHTYQYQNENIFYDLSDYANKVAEYTKDPQLVSIARELDEALDKAILGRNITATTAESSPYILL